MQSPAPTETSAGAPAPEGGAGGLPQFDLATWPGQAAWFLIFFVIVLVLMARVFVPRIGGTIAEREGKIEGDVAEARRLKEEADAQAAAAESEIAQARAQAMKVASDARAKAQGEIAARLAQEEAKLAETSQAAEARIAAARAAAMGHVSEIATDAAQAIVQKLTGQAPTKAELASAGRA
jgi:F-type H+-transporting ATPase subunit b